MLLLTCPKFVTVIRFCVHIVLHPRIEAHRVCQSNNVYNTPCSNRFHGVLIVASKQLVLVLKNRRNDKVEEKMHE